MLGITTITATKTTTLNQIDKWKFQWRVSNLFVQLFIAYITLNINKRIAPFFVVEFFVVKVKNVSRVTKHLAFHFKLSLQELLRTKERQREKEAHHARTLFNFNICVNFV